MSPKENPMPETMPEGMTNRKKLATLRRLIGEELRTLKRTRREIHRNYSRWGKDNPKLWATGPGFDLKTFETLRKLLRAIDG